MIYNPLREGEMLMTISTVCDGSTVKAERCNCWPSTGQKLEELSEKYPHFTIVVEVTGPVTRTDISVNKKTS